MNLLSIMNIYIHFHYIICCFLVMWATTDSVQHDVKAQVKNERNKWITSTKTEKKKVTISNAMNVQMENDKRRNNTNNDKMKTQKDRKNTDKKTNKNKKRKAWKGFKMLQADPPRSIACICLLFLQRDCPQVMKWEPKFSRNIRHLGMFFFCCALLHCQRMLISNEIQWKKNCHQEFEFSWTNKLCLGAWLRFRHWTAFNPMFFPPIMKVEAGPFGFTGLPSRQQIRQTNTTILWTNMYNPLSQFFRGRDLPHLKKATIKHQHYDMPNHCGAIRP